MANLQIQRGTQANAASSSPFTARGLADGSLAVSELRSRYYQQVKDGKVFSASIVGQTTTVGLATTYTGLCLSNPISSTVDLAVTKVGYSFIVAFAAGAHIGLMTGFNATTNVTHTAAVTVRSQYFTGATATSATGLVDSSATLPTAPTVNLILASGLTGAITTTPFIPSGTIDLEGALVIPPGGYVAFYTSTASGTNAGGFSFQWEEIPTSNG